MNRRIGRASDAVAVAIASPLLSAGRQPAGTELSLVAMTAA